MVDLARQQRLALFSLLAVGDVDGHAADAHDVVSGVDARHRRSDTPAQLAVRPADAKFALKARRVGRRRLDRVLQMLPVLGVDERPDIVDGEVEARGIDAEDPILPIVPHEVAVDGIPFPRSHLTGGQRQAATLFALHQPRGRGLQFRRSLRDATLELLVELFELPGFAIELGEDPDLGAQHFGNDRHRDVIDRAHFIGAQSIDVGQMDGGNEDDRGALKTRMLADHRGQLEAVEFGHAHVHEDDGNVMLEEVFERLFGRGSLDEPLAELGQNGLVAQEFGWLVVDQQDIDLVLRGHRPSPRLAMQPHAQRR